MDIRLTFQDFFQIRKKTEFSCAVSPPHAHCHTHTYSHTHTHTHTHTQSILKKLSIISILFDILHVLLCLSLGCAHPQERTVILLWDVTIPKPISLGMSSTKYKVTTCFSSLIWSRGSKSPGRLVQTEIADSTLRVANSISLEWGPRTCNSRSFGAATGQFPPIENP